MVSLQLVVPGARVFVEGLFSIGFRVSSLFSRVSDLEYGVWGFGLRVWGSSAGKGVRSLGFGWFRGLDLHFFDLLLHVCDFQFRDSVSVSGFWVGGHIHFFDLLLHIRNFELAWLDLLFELFDLVVQHELELLQFLWFAKWGLVSVAGCGCWVKPRIPFRSRRSFISSPLWTP